MNPFKAGKTIAKWGSNPENAIGSIPYVGQSYWNQKNYEQQQQKLGWDQFVQYQTWGREDNATQRRAADLKAAGLSPVLAAGQPAQAGAVVSTTAPQREHADMSDTALKVMTLLTQKANIETQESQRKLMQLQGQQATANSLEALARIQKIPSEIDRNMANAGMARAGASDHIASAKSRLHDLLMSQRTHTVTKPGVFGQIMRDVFNIGAGAAETTGGGNTRSNVWPHGNIRYRHAEPGTYVDDRGNVRSIRDHEIIRRAR